MNTKIKIILFSALLCLLYSDCRSQELNESQNKKNTFYIDPVRLFLNTIELGIEHKLKNTNTITLLGGFKLSENSGKVNRLGGNGELQYRINLLYDREGSSRVNRNFTTFAYFAPYVEYKYEEITDRNESLPLIRMESVSTISSWFGGAGFGCRFSGINNRFCLNIFAGGGLKYSDLYGDDKYSDFFQPGYTGISPKLECQLGIAF